LLREGADAATVLRLCARLGLDPAGRVYPVASGLLLRLEFPSHAFFPGTLRLRALAENLFLPVDADLVPALLDDEAEGLTRGRGLVFLPGARVLGFDPARPLDPADLLRVRRKAPRVWQPLPLHVPLAERIEEIRVDVPGLSGDDAADDVLETGHEEFGDAPLPPTESGAAATLAGNAALGAGQWLLALGRGLGLPGLTAFGAGWIRRAIELAPQLGESVFGRQEAALRALLREFREGDLERALRHAPSVGDVPRGSSIDAGANLPARNPKYDLADLLGKISGGGPARVWLGGGAVMAELAREYRRAAEAALNRGDYRRAAFIYGKLLRDYRLAAHALLRGGLYRDAAALFLSRLGDSRAAATALVSAGELDRAIGLYRQLGDHREAGDLLQRLGETEAALAEYRLAAERLAASPAGHLAAGELLLSKTGRTDLALAHFRAGWALRPSEGNAVACAFQMVRIFAELGARGDLLELLDEADALFARPGFDQPAGRFYDEVVHHAELPVMAEARDDLRDRVLQSLGTKLRQGADSGARPVAILANLFPHEAAWAPPLLHDAEFALESAARRIGPAPREDLPGDVVRIGSGGVVSAVCAAPGAGTIFLGFASGEVYVYRPETSKAVLVAAHDFPAVSLATDDEGSTLGVLRAGYGGVGALSFYKRRADGTYVLHLGTPVDRLASPWLTPVLRDGARSWAGFWDGNALGLLDLEMLMPFGSPLRLETTSPPECGHLVAWPEEKNWSFLYMTEGQWWVGDYMTTLCKPLGLPGRAAVPRAGTLRHAVVAVAWPAPDLLELAFVGHEGVLQWGRFSLSAGTVEALGSGIGPGPADTQAVALLRPGLVARISGPLVHWLRVRQEARTYGGREHLQHLGAQPTGLDGVVAAFACRRTGELVLVRGDGATRRILPVVPRVGEAARG
jgi:tetratricopeptide (TPR) repeat protein